MKTLFNIKTKFKTVIGYVLKTTFALSLIFTICKMKICNFYNKFI